MGVMVNFNWVIADAIRSRYEKPSGIKNPDRMRFISSLLYFDVHSVMFLWLDVFEYTLHKKIIC